MQKRENIKRLVPSQKFSGKILVAEIDKTVIDGASEGLVDIYDCPPIDTTQKEPTAKFGQHLYMDTLQVCFQKPTNAKLETVRPNKI